MIISSSRAEEDQTEGGSYSRKKWREKGGEKMGKSSEQVNEMRHANEQGDWRLDSRKWGPTIPGLNFQQQKIPEIDYIL